MSDQASEHMTDTPAKQRPEHVVEAMERASAAADRVEAEYEEGMRVAVENVKVTYKESVRTRKAFIRSLFQGYKVGLPYQELADACGLDVGGVFRLMQRHGRDGQLLTPEARGTEHTRARGRGRRRRTG